MTRLFARIALRRRIALAFWVMNVALGLVLLAFAMRAVL